jgi:hypothetical protein
LGDLRIMAGPYEFVARWEREKSPETCEAFERLLPYRQRIIHVRWSGESCWIPLGDFDLGVGFEEATSYPAPGEILLYPGGYSETEILRDHPLREQARTARRQPLPDRDRGKGEPALPRGDDPLGRSPGYSLREGLENKSRAYLGRKPAEFLDAFGTRSYTS